jgi:hypothetical protein
LACCSLALAFSTLALASSRAALAWSKAVWEVSPFLISSDWRSKSACLSSSSACALSRVGLGGGGWPLALSRLA